MFTSLSDMPVPKVLELIKGIKADKESGAAELADKSMEVLVLQISESNAETLESYVTDIKEVFKLLRDARPYMGPLFNAIRPLLRVLEQLPSNVVTLKKDLLRVMKSKQKAKSEVTEEINKNLKQVLATVDSLLTMSYSSTLLKALLMHSSSMTIFILESRPLNEGLVMAEKLGPKHDVIVLTDMAMGATMPVDLVVVGADSILKDGSVINKIGTFPLAVISKEFNVPFYVVADSSKFNIPHYFGSAITIEENDPREVLPKGNLDIKVSNKYFDITPSKYISAIVSELGVLSPKDFIKRMESQSDLQLFKEYLV